MNRDDNIILHYNVWLPINILMWHPIKHSVALTPTRVNKYDSERLTFETRTKYALLTFTPFRNHPLSLQSIATGP